MPLKKIGNMATKRAKVNKTLEKAKKLVSKKVTRKLRKVLGLKDKTDHKAKHTI